MKKCLVLMLVLGLATMANAAYVVTVTGDASMNTGATKTYTVSFSRATADSALTGYDIDLHLDSTLATPGLVTITVGGRDTAFDLIYDTPYTTPPDYGKEASAAAPYGGSLTDGSLFTIAITAGLNTGTITISTESILMTNFLNEAIYPTMGDLDVEIIPEPATLALLGLGGLLLRRRK